MSEFERLRRLAKKYGVILTGWRDGSVSLTVADAAGIRAMFSVNFNGQAMINEGKTAKQVLVNATAGAIGTVLQDPYGAREFIREAMGDERV